jgi:hypothetical protein
MRTSLLIAAAVLVTPIIGFAGAVPVTTHIVQKTSSANASAHDDVTGRALLRNVAAAQSEITRVINELRSEFENSPELRDARSALRTAQANYNDAVNTALAPALGEPTLRIHPRCRELIRSMECYHYGPKGEKPVKDGKYDHCTDALRYFYVNRPTPTKSLRY